MDTIRDNYVISTDKAKLDVSYIHQYLCFQSYWAGNIPIDIVKQSIEGSLCFGLFDGEKQIGFARMVTDAATFAFLADVFVDEKYRGKGLSKWLMEVMMAFTPNTDSARCHFPNAGWPFTTPTFIRVNKFIFAPKLKRDVTGRIYQE